MAAKKSAAKTLKSAPRSSSRSTRRPATMESKSADAVVTIDRRRGVRRGKISGEATAAAEPPVTAPAPAAALERRKKVQRRRQIDPTTCERDYSIEEVEFMNAMDEYKRKNGRMFPTCSEVLEVIRDLSYVKLSPSERTLLGLDQSQNVEEKLDAVDDVLDSLLDETL
jgi:hypothetical protein